MTDEQHEHDEEQQERSRPRVVDKRISARKESDPPPPQTDPAPPAEPGPAPVDTPDDETFRPPADETPDAGGPAGEAVWTPEQEAEAQRIVAEIDRVAARDWVVNAAMNLVNVASVKLDRGDGAGAQLTIDALAGILEKTGARLGDAEGPLRQVLAQLQMAYAGSVAGGPGPGPSA
jgi:hypothetical protein